MTPTIEELARGLTEAQKRAVMEARKMPEVLHGDDCYEVKAGGATIALRQKCIIRPREFRRITGRTRRGYTLTPLGLTLRSHLEKTHE